MDLGSSNVRGGLRKQRCRVYVITAQTRHSLRRAGAAAWVSSYITTNRSWRHHLCGRAGSQMSGERIQYVPDPTRGPVRIQPVELWCSRKVQIDPHPGSPRSENELLRANGRV